MQNETLLTPTSPTVSLMLIRRTSVSNITKRFVVHLNRLVWNVHQRFTSLAALMPNLHHMVHLTHNPPHRCQCARSYPHIYDWSTDTLLQIIRSIIPWGAWIWAGWWTSCHFALRKLEKYQWYILNYSISPQENLQACLNYRNAHPVFVSLRV